MCRTRAASDVESLDRSEWVTTLAGVFASGNVVSADNTLVAVAGDSLCLTRSITDVDGNISDYLFVLESNGEMGCRADMFDPDQITEAQTLMQIRWFDQLGLPADHYLRRLIASALSVDPTVTASMFHPDLELTEHRRLSFNTSGDYDHVVESTASLTVIDHVVYPIIHRWSDHAMFSHRDEVAANGDATSALNVTAIRDGLVISLDIYDLDDFAPALARYEELKDGKQPDADPA